MSGPRTKRPFAGAASDPAQRQITSFFNKSTGFSSLENSSSPTSATSSPALPAHVQSNLLSVGMRVRKSVPEGYKTGDPSGSCADWNGTNRNAAQNNTALNASRPAVQSSNTGRELQPFCGIHKTGGLAVQPETFSFSHYISSGSSSANLPVDAFPGSWDGPSNSQESTSSTDSTDSATVASNTISTRMNLTFNGYSGFANHRKRRAPEQDVGGDDTPDIVLDEMAMAAGARTPVQWRSHEDWLNGEVSPRSLAPASWGSNSRVLAVPRRKGRAAMLAAARSAREETLLGQENMAVADDFEEASFLDQECRGEMMDVE